MHTFSCESGIPHQAHFLLTKLFAILIFKRELSRYLLLHKLKTYVYIQEE